MLHPLKPAPQPASAFISLYTCHTYNTLSKCGLLFQVCMAAPPFTSAASPVLRPARTSMRVVFPAPETPMRQVSTPGRKQPLMSVSSTSCGRATPSTASPLASEPCADLQHVREHDESSNLQHTPLPWAPWPPSGVLVHCVSA